MYIHAAYTIAIVYVQTFGKIHSHEGSRKIRKKINETNIRIYNILYCESSPLSNNNKKKVFTVNVENIYMSEYTDKTFQPYKLTKFAQQ